MTPEGNPYWETPTPSEPDTPLPEVTTTEKGDSDGLIPAETLAIETKDEQQREDSLLDVPDERIDRARVVEKEIQGLTYDDPRRKQLLEGYYKEFHPQSQTLELPDEEDPSPTAKSAQPAPLPPSPGQEQVPDQPREWRDVSRASRVDAFGDLNGSATSFVEHLKAQNLITLETGDTLRWTGGNTRTVFVGDVLGDRTPQGLRVMKAVQELNQAAQAEGGCVDVLAGNHENFFFSTMMDKDQFAAYPETGVDSFGAYAGVFELSPYYPPELKERFQGLVGESIVAQQQKLHNFIAELVNRAPGTPEHTLLVGHIERAQALIPTLENLSQRMARGDAQAFINATRCFNGDRGFLPPEKIGQFLMEVRQGRKSILENAKNDLEGRKSLEAACQFKIAALHDDTLFVHTELTRDMARMLLEKGVPLQEKVERLNQTFQAGLRAGLLGEGPLDEESSALFGQLRKTFLRTENTRNEYTEQKDVPGDTKEKITRRLRGEGVNLVVHGHYDDDGKTHGHPDLPIVTIDRSAYREGENKSPISHLRVETNGSVAGEALPAPLRVA